MKRRRNHGRSLTAGTLALRFIEKLVPKDQLDLVRVQALWEANVPPHLTRFAWPVAVRDRAVVVHVANNQWLHELVYLRSELLSCLRPQDFRDDRGSTEDAGEARRDADRPLWIDDIRFRVGELPERLPPVPDPPPPKVIDLAPEPSPETLEALREIEDPRLRQAAANARMALSGVSRPRT